MAIEKEKDKKTNCVENGGGGKILVRGSFNQ